MAGRTRKLRDWRPPRWGVVTAIVLVLLAGLVVAWDDNWLKSPIERRVTASTGRTFDIAGDLDISLGAPLTVRADGVAFGNARWSKDRVMARARRVRIDIDPWPLLRGRVDIRHIALDTPELLLERDRQGKANWRLDRRRPGRSSMIIRALTVRDGTLRVREPSLRTNLKLALQTEPQEAKDGRAPLVADGAGRYRNEDFRLHGRLDSPLRLLRRGEDYRLDLTASAGTTRLHAYGALEAPINLNRFEVNAEASGEDLEDLYRLVGIAAPETPPYRVKGLLSRERNTWRFTDLEGRVGDSDVSGDVSVEIGRKRPFVRARLYSKLLDFDDLGVLVGAPPGTKPGETASPEQRAEAQQRSTSPRVLPDKPYNLEKLRSVDAVVQLKADRVNPERLPVDAIETRLRLRNGLLRVDPLNVAIAGGQMTGTIRLDARRNPIATQANLRMRGVELPKLLPRLSPNGFGSIAGRARLEGRGNSVARMLATADGDVGVMMGSGKVSNLVLELAGLDVAEALKFLVGKDKTVPVRCAYTDLTVDQGVAKTRSLALDTTDTVIVGSGTIDLTDEQLDLELKPRPKDVSPISLRGPLEVRGTFKDPDFQPKAAPLAGRVAAAAALFAIAPPAALLALFETGPGKDIDCSDPAVSAATSQAESPTTTESTPDEKSTPEEESPTNKTGPKKP